MLSRKHRLHKEKEIKQVLTKGSFYYTPFLNVKYLPNKSNTPRFCIIISNKVSKNAVLRNRTRRRVRASIIQNLSDFPSSDFVFILKNNTPLATIKDIDRDLQKILSKIR